MVLKITDPFRIPLSTRNHWLIVQFPNADGHQIHIGMQELRTRSLRQNC